MSERERVTAWVESREFYELGQAYRHAPLVPQEGVVRAWDALKDAIIDKVAALTPAPTPPAGVEALEQAKRIVATGYTFCGPTSSGMMQGVAITYDEWMTLRAVVDALAAPPTPAPDRTARELPDHCEHWHTDGTFCRPCVMRLLTRPPAGAAEEKSS